jgi:hypothetical protein
MKSSTTGVDAIQARMSRLVTAIDTDQCQRHTDQCHPVTGTDHRQRPLTVMDQHLAAMDTCHHRLTLGTNTDQCRVGMATGDRQHPLTAMNQSPAVMHTGHPLTGATDTDQARGTNTAARIATGAPLGRRPPR